MQHCRRDETYRRHLDVLCIASGYCLLVLLTTKVPSNAPTVLTHTNTHKSPKYKINTEFPTEQETLKIRLKKV
jgi:hypothetical protein